MTAEDIFMEAESFYKKYRNMIGTEEEWTAAAQDMVDSYNRSNKCDLMKNLLLAVFDTLSERQKNMRPMNLDKETPINF